MKVSSVTFEEADGDEFVVYLDPKGSRTVILERNGKCEDLDNVVKAAHRLASMRFKDDDDLEDVDWSEKAAIISEYEGQILTILEQMR